MCTLKGSDDFLHHAGSICHWQAVSEGCHRSQRSMTVGQRSSWLSHLPLIFFNDTSHPNSGWGPEPQWCSDINQLIGQWPIFLTLMTQLTNHCNLAMAKNVQRLGGLHNLWTEGARDCLTGTETRWNIRHKEQTDWYSWWMALLILFQRELRRQQFHMKVN